MRGSDRTVRHGHISKQGSAWLRWILCEAAQTAKRHPDFAATYTAMARRRGKKIATTAVARRLLTRAYHLLNQADTAGRRPDQSSRTRPATAGPTSKVAIKPTTRTRTTPACGARQTHSPTGTVTSPGRARKTA